MSEQTEIGTQTLDSSSETTEVGFRQEPKLKTPVNETSANKITLRSADEGIKLVTDPILRRIEETFALLMSRTEMESAGNSKKSGSTCNHESISPSCNPYGMGTGVQTNPL